MPYTMNDVVNGEAKIKIIGVGGAGGNAVANMVVNSLEGVKFYVANTDRQALENNPAETKIQIGDKLTNGLGAGGNPEFGKKAAKESTEEIRESLKDADMIFIAAGMGGGTGTGASPIVAKIAKELDALTVGVVTKPFRFEGRRRMRLAEEGISELEKEVDALIVIPNDKLLSLSSGGKIAIQNSFKITDNVLFDAAKGITELILNQGYINVDFMDVRSVMSEKGRALMGMGRHKGENAAIEAVKSAISSPLLENVSIAGATGVLINFTMHPDTSLNEIYEATDLIESMCNEDANVIWGTAFDDSLDNEVRVTIVATGFEKNPTSATQNIKQRSFIKEEEKIQEISIEDSSPIKAEEEIQKRHSTGMNYELFHDGRNPSSMPELPIKKHKTPSVEMPSINRELPTINMNGNAKRKTTNTGIHSKAHEITKPAYIRNLESSINKKI